jgi:tRNA dimethylallyltransferase
MKPPTLIFLMGPTACGKSSLALEMARHMPCEIISVDSALVYQGMDIGTAKPTKIERAEIPHHLIDICDPKFPYSVADFIRDAKRAIDDILSRGKIPLLVGGTMMYFHALKTGLSTLPSSDPKIRLQLEKRIHAESLNALYQELLQVDPLYAKTIHENDTQRILRALEVYTSTGTPLSLWQKTADKKILEYNIRALAIMPADRNVLHQTINLRFDQMLAQGFMEEMQTLFNRGDLSADLPAMRAVGYRQAWHYLSGGCDWTQMRASSLAATRQLAKRQITWLRKWEDLSWFVPNCINTILSHLRNP